MEPGTVVAERYALLEKSAEGGMAALYRAADREDGTTVALKVLLRASGLAYERFAREAQVLSELDHPAVVRYLDHGTTTLNGFDAAYLAMEWCDGPDLSDRLEARPLSARESVELAVRIAEGVGEAHRRGIVHRDLKPQNLILVDDRVERVKVVDFGLAHVGGASIELTRPGAILGTPSFLAPELARGEPADARADVWSIGCILYECLSHHRAFGGEVPVAVLAKIILEEPTPLSELCPDLPPEVGRLVTRMLSKDRADRPKDGASAAREIEELRQVVARSTEPRSSHLIRMPALTDVERELVSVIVAPFGGEGDARTSLPPDPSVRIHRLADGSMVAVLHEEGEATDRVTRAARAALRLREALPGRSLALATGYAVAQPELPVAEVIDRAAALASAPDHDAVRIDELTAGLLPARFEVLREGGAIRLTAERGAIDPGRTLLGVRTRCVGRQKELRMLEAVVDACAEEPSAEIALLVGAAGVGKSRVVHELIGRMASRADRWQVWTARADEVGAGSPFALVSSALSSAVGLRVGDAFVDRRARLAAFVSRRVPEPDRARVTEFLAELLGIGLLEGASEQLRAARSDHRLMGDQIRRAFVDLVSAEVGHAPLCLVLEDLHWGDLPSVTMIEAALARLSDAPLMILAAARPEVHERFRDLFRDRGVEELHLSPLSPRAAESLVREVLGDDADPKSVRRIVERAGGNAFSLEELVRSEAEGRGAEVPPTVIAMTQARLEAMEGDARRILRAAAIYGRAFWRGAVAELLGGERGIYQLDRWLETLAEREVISAREPARFATETELVFRHDVVREAAYRMLTDEDRALGHRLAAGWLEDAGERDAVVLAQHWQQAEQPERAARHWLRAAREALEGNDLEAAVARAASARECAAGDAQVRGEAALVDVDAHLWRNEHARVLERAFEAADALDSGSAGWSTALAGAVASGVQLGRPEEATRAARRLVQAWREGHDEPRLAHSLARASISVRVMGNEGALADELAEGARAIERGLPEPELLVSATCHRQEASAALARGDLALAAEHLAESRTGFERAGDLRNVVLLSADLGYVLRTLGANDRAEPVLRDALERAEDLGLAMVTGYARTHLGLAVAGLGRLDEAIRLQREAVEDSRAHENRRMEVNAGAHLARVQWQAGDLDGAERTLADALATADGGFLPYRTLCHVVAAHVALERGAIAAGLERAEEAMELAQELGYEEEIATEARLAHALALEAAGRQAEADRVIDEAATLLRERAAKIGDDALRRSFIRIDAHARILALADRS